MSRNEVGRMKGGGGNNFGTCFSHQKSAIMTYVSVLVPALRFCPKSNPLRFRFVLLSCRKWKMERTREKSPTLELLVTFYDALTYQTT